MGYQHTLSAEDEHIFSMSDVTFLWMWARTPEHYQKSQGQLFQEEKHEHACWKSSHNQASRESESSVNARIACGINAAASKAAFSIEIVLSAFDSIT